MSKEKTGNKAKVTPISKMVPLKKSFEISKDMTAELHACDIMYSSLKNQIANMIETHAKDEKDVLTTSPIFMGLLNTAAESCKEFEKAKYLVPRLLPVEEGNSVDEWSLDYASKCVTYEESKAVKNDKTLTVPEDVYNPVWDAQMLHQALADVITWLTNSHANDKKDTITSSAVFKGVLKLKAQLFEKFNVAKEEMFKQMVPESDRAKYSNWELSYDGGVLTLTE